MKRIGSVLMTLILLLCAVLTALPAPALAAGSNPNISLGAGALTAGNKVWFGSYSNSPILWRVLQSGDGKALLISNDTLAKTKFNQSASDGNAWSGSNAQTWCQNFKNDTNFTVPEQAAILATTIEETENYTYNSPHYGEIVYGPAPLNGEYFFFLSAKEAVDLFADDDDNDRKASGADNYWWLRSPHTGSAGRVGGVNSSGWVCDYPVSVENGARPAFNLNLPSVLFTSKIQSQSNPTESYKLTLYDSNITVTEGSSGVTWSGSTVTVPYAITGSDAGNANKVALLITGKNDTWSATNGWSSGAAKLYYETQAVNAASGSVSFTLPDSLKNKTCGTDYKAWLLAVDENGNHESDYASALVGVTIPKDVEKYPLWVGGVRADENNCNKLTENHWSYDDATHTLTLSDYTYSGKGYQYYVGAGYYAGIYYIGAADLTISLSGTNSVTQTEQNGDPGDCPIVIDSNHRTLTITGSGSLTVRQADSRSFGPAILNNGPITLSGGTVKAVGAKRNGIKASSVTVKSTVTSVDIKGSGDSAKAVDGTLINEIGGVGYDQQNQPTKIAANTTGAALTYQRVVFPISQYTLRFDANGGGGSMADVTVEEGDSYELPDCGFTPPTGNKFSSWEVSGADGVYYAGNPVFIASNCADANGVVTITAKWQDADKAPQATVKTTPTALNPTYNGGNQALVSAGTAEGGTMSYALGSDASTSPASGWSADVPTAANYGTYYVWYKAAGDNAHTDSAAACVTAGIGQKAVTVTAKAQTVKEGEAIQTGTAWAMLTDAVNGHSLSAVTLTAANGKITPSSAKIQDTGENDVTGNYSISYAAGDVTVLAKINATVIFKVVNGGWNDETLTGDQTVTLTGYEGDALKLTAAQIPAAGNKPDDTFKAGSWDTTPSTDTAFANGSTTTYTYTYAKKDSISAKVTFKVVNGDWNDENLTGDQTVTLTGLEGDTLKLAAAQIPAVGNKPADTYKAGAWDVTPSTETAITAPTTYTYTYAPKGQISVTVTLKVVHGTWDDGTREDKRIVLTGLEGDELRLTLDDMPGVTKPDEGYEFGSGTWTPSEPPINLDGEPPMGDPITEDTTFTYTYGAMSKAAVTTSPAVKELTYNDSAQALVTAGTAENGAMAYALGADAATAPTTGWSEAIPTGTDAGTYYVWYKAIGDEFHLDSDPAVVTAVIAAPGGSETGEMQTLPGAPVLIDSNMADVVKSVVDAIQKGTLTGIPAEVKAALAQPGAKVTLTLISKPLADSEMPAQDKAALDAAAKANGYDGYRPFDLSLLLTVTDPVTNETVSTYIHVSSKGVTFSLQVPEGLKKTGRTFCLLSCHDGKVDALSSTTGDVLAGESSLFSTYAIAYKDAAEPVSNTFYFKKVWEGGTKKSIDFTLYTADGKVNRQGFEKHILSKKEWSYSAVFQDAGSCYLIEKPIPGYITRYVNVGEYAGITDRCCNGGTIINKKIPKTGDETPILLLAGMLLIGASGITAALIVSKRRKARK